MKFSRHCGCGSEVDQCEAVQEHLPLIALLQSMAAVLGNWSDILHSEQPESRQTAGLRPFGACLGAAAASWNGAAFASRQTPGGRQVLRDQQLDSEVFEDSKSSLSSCC